MALILDSITYKIKGEEILKGCYLKLTKNRVTSLVGVNGSGKSTLIKVAAGQINPNNGFTDIDGEKLYKKNKQKRYKKICYLPQKSFFNPNQRVSTYLNISRFKNNPFIDHSIYNTKIGDLSTGMRRFLEVHLILSLNRTYYLLDEPFSGIEPNKIESLIEVIKTLKENGKSILLVDHYHSYVKSVADTYYIMDDGSTLRQ